MPSFVIFSVIFDDAKRGKSVYPGTKKMLEVIPKKVFKFLVEVTWLVTEVCELCLILVLIILVVNQGVKLRGNFVILLIF